MLHTETPNTPLSILRPDAKGRITLGKLAEGISSYHATLDKQGRIILEPYAEIPAHEHWLYQNKDALNAVRAGIADSKAGRVSYLGDFSQYLEE